jgi:hypothetical protein
MKQSGPTGQKREADARDDTRMSGLEGDGFESSRQREGQGGDANAYAGKFISGADYSSAEENLREGDAHTAKESYTRHSFVHS